MKGLQFDALARTIGTTRNRRGVAKGALALATGLWALQRGGSPAAAQNFWPCPDGVDGHRFDCMCICRRISNPGSAAACQRACLECEGHAWPVCSDVDDGGNPTGEPVCCADRQPCLRVCGDCPDCEPLADFP